MFRFLMHWLIRGLMVLAATFVLVYLGDWAVYRLRGAPQSKVTVNSYVAIPLKGRKTEFDYQGTQDVPCSVSLFSQSGQPPCWQLRRNPNPGLTM
ncbi:MAG TPA: hypothetical protein VMV39_01580 [Terracidiphilus sp.]|nr:hypothetical protein [Terracidiphilus sp.]